MSLLGVPLLCLFSADAQDCEIKIRLIFRNSQRLLVFAIFDEVAYAVDVSPFRHSYVRGQLGTRKQAPRRETVANQRYSRSLNSQLRAFSKDREHWRSVHTAAGPGKHADPSFATC